jgi:signal peptidase I
MPDENNKQIKDNLQPSSDGDSPSESSEPTIKLSPDVEDAFLEGPQVHNTLTSEAQAKADEEEGEEEPDDTTGGIKSALKLIAAFAGILIFVLIIFNFVFKTYLVDGLSMFPTFNDRDRVVLLVAGKTVSNIFSTDHIPNRGDVIVLENPNEAGVDFIKRVIALPGERIVLENGKYTVYNEEFPEGFDPDTTFEANLRYTDGQVDMEIPEGHIFVSGDNREPGGSLDSRNELGPIPVEKIKGRVILRFLPITSLDAF